MRLQPKSSNYLGFGFQPMFAIFFDRIIAEQGEAGQTHVPAANLMVERHQEFLDSGGTVKSDDLQVQKRKYVKYPPGCRTRALQFT